MGRGFGRQVGSCDSAVDDFDWCWEGVSCEEE